MEITLTRGYTAVIDDAAEFLVGAHKWHASGRAGAIYAVRFSVDEGVRRLLFMHRVIASAKEADSVDHRDGDTLNNRRSNLRLCARRDNAKNRKLNANSTTGCKGVTCSQGRFRGQVSIDGKMVRRRFATLEEADAWCRARRAEWHGEFVRPD